MTGDHFQKGPADLTLWVIYEKGSDNEEGLWTARAWRVALPDPVPLDFVVRSPDIDELREHFRQMGRFRIERDEFDAPNIVESWW